MSDMSANGQLKDFQLATVNYVFDRFADETNPCNRFLVADEVGLGKTLIAKGIIQKFYDRYRMLGVPRLNVIYICSNQSIASQNLNRLNVEQQYHERTSRIDRLNDLAITRIEDNARSYLQLIALSPSTSFKVSSGGGMARERAIIFHALCSDPEFGAYRQELLEFLQLDVSRARWEELTARESELKSKLRKPIVERFIEMVKLDADLRVGLGSIHEGTIDNVDSSPKKFVGKLRKLLASVCVEYLKPDLIIMDEFQRFKDIIDRDDESDSKLITESLFANSQIKILLLSATPYRMFTVQSDDEIGESHYEEFRFVMDFLLNDPEKLNAFYDAWDAYSSSLLHLHGKNWGAIKMEKSKVEEILRSVIARTERIAVSDDKNTLLRPSEPKHIWIKPDDIQTFVEADSVAAMLMDVHSPIEYCKSSPFPFSFMEGYQLQRVTKREVIHGNEDIVNQLRKAKNAFLPVESMNDFADLGDVNAKLNFLLQDMLHNGGSDLLWIPPSLPYYEFEGAYKGKETFSKTLVFSSWLMVPKMIAALTSYECERLTIGHPDSFRNSEERTERKYFHKGSERHPRARLTLKLDGNNFSSLTHYALLYPCMVLGELWKPLEKFAAIDELIAEVGTQISEMIKQISIKEFITDPNKKGDDRWALVYMLLFDRKLKKAAVNNLGENLNEFDWRWFDSDSDSSISDKYLDKVFVDILFANQPPDLSATLLRMRGVPGDPVEPILYQLKLGQPPEDIATQLAYLTIASPAICAYRTLSSYSQNSVFHYQSFYGAFRIAEGFRKFFNVPENTAIVDKYADLNTYWKNVLRYCAAGNIQSMLDEFASVLLDHQGLWNLSLQDKLSKLTDSISGNLGLRTVAVAGHTFESFIDEDRPQNFRSHFGVALNQSLTEERDIIRSDRVRDSFNSPFWPFVLATTSIGQEGLDFHLYCRKILHWNLPANPVDFEQREGRINRFKNLAIRQNLAKKYRTYIENSNAASVWDQLFQRAIDREKGAKSDLVPYWHVEPENIFIERQVPTIPYSKEVKKLEDLLRTISVYRIALGQPRQEELVKYIVENCSEEEIDLIRSELLINLSPYKRTTYGSGVEAKDFISTQAAD